MIYVIFHESNPALKNPFSEHSAPSPAFWQIWGKDYTFWQQEPTSPLISHLAPCHWKNVLFSLPEVLRSRAGPLCPMKVLSITGCFSSGPSHPHPNARYLWGSPVVPIWVLPTAFRGVLWMVEWNGFLEAMKRSSLQHGREGVGTGPSLLLTAPPPVSCDTVWELSTHPLHTFFPKPVVLGT